jgi:hypothetical protein
MMKKRLSCVALSKEKNSSHPTLAPQMQNRMNEDGGRECDHREDGLKTRRSPIDGV